MKRIFAQTWIILLLSGTTYAQHREIKADSSKPYWLNYSLIFLKGSQPKVFPGNITFTQGDERADPYSGSILTRGTKVKISSINRGKDFARVTLKYWPIYWELSIEYEILLKDDSEQNFRKSFKLLFSEQEVPNEYKCPDEVKTKTQVIQCYGFPISIETENGVERYNYILEFVGPNPYSGMYDGFTIKIKKNRVIEVYGSI